MIQEALTATDEWQTTAYKTSHLNHDVLYQLDSRSDPCLATVHSGKYYNYNKNNKIQHFYSAGVEINFFFN